jgi:hypothetical protein
MAQEQLKSAMAEKLSIPSGNKKLHRAAPGESKSDAGHIDLTLRAALSKRNPSETISRSAGGSLKKCPTSDPRPVPSIT